jgi:hypothetical protein
MATQGRLIEALELSESLLEELEMNLSSLTLIAMKASRLARIVGQFEVQQILQYETSGYPRNHTGVEPEAWRLAKMAGRTYKQEVDGVVKEFAKLEIIEELEIIADTAKSRPFSLNSLQQSKNAQAVKQAIEALAKRRAYVYNFVSSVYFELKFSAVANDVFERTRIKVDSKVGEVIPNAVKMFSAVYENLLSGNDEDWSNAVHSCRRILENAADVLYPARADKVIGEGARQKVIKLGAGSYVNRLMAYVEEHATSERFTEIVGSHLGYLGERLDSIFEAANKGTHKVISSREEADRYVIYTYLFIGDILQLKSEVDRGQSATEN